MSAGGARAPCQPARRAQAVRPAAITEHVRGASAPQTSASLRPAPVRSESTATPIEPSRSSDALRDAGRWAPAWRSFFLRERKLEEPVRVRAADLVQQPAFWRTERQQGSALGRSRQPGPDPESYDDSATAQSTAHASSPAFRYRESRSVLVPAKSHCPPLPRCRSFVALPVGGSSS